MDRVTNIPREALDGEDLICRGATVLSVEGDIAHVRIDQDKGCETCGSKGHCAVMLGGQSVLTVRTHSAVSAGMRVEIGMRPAAIFTASVLMFVLPAVAFIIGIVLGYWIAEPLGWPDQWTGFGFGVLLFILSFLLVKMITPRLEAKGDYEPVITRILDE
jgi:positive regulator of sigma E activity